MRLLLSILFLVSIAYCGKCSTNSSKLSKHIFFLTKNTAVLLPTYTTPRYDLGGQQYLANETALVTSVTFFLSGMFFTTVFLLTVDLDNAIVYVYDSLYNLTAFTASLPRNSSTFSDKLNSFLAGTYFRNSTAIKFTFPESWLQEAGEYYYFRMNDDNGDFYMYGNEMYENRTDGSCVIAYAGGFDLDCMWDPGFLVTYDKLNCCNPECQYGATCYEDGSCGCSMGFVYDENYNCVQGFKFSIF